MEVLEVDLFLRDVFIVHYGKCGLYFTAHRGSCPKGFGARHTQALILFVSLTVAFAMRSHLSVTLVAMTGNTTNCYPVELSHDNITVGNLTRAYSLPETADLCKESSKNWSVYRVSFAFQNINYQVFVLY